jgi:hypothetical protein
MLKCKRNKYDLTLKTGDQKMNENILFQIESAIQKIAPGFGYTCFMFDFQSPQYASYITNAKKSDMLKSLKTAVQYLENPSDNVLNIPDCVCIGNYSFIVR